MKKKIISLLVVLAMLVAIVPAVFAADEETTVYLDPGCWNVDGAWFAAYYWNTNGSNWVKMTAGDTYYEATIPAGYSNVIFCRMDGSKTALDWSSKWNQTDDLTLGSGNLYTITGWGSDKSTGEWSTYTPSVPGDSLENPLVYDSIEALCEAWNGYTLNADQGIYVQAPLGGTMLNITDSTGALQVVIGRLVNVYLNECANLTYTADFTMGYMEGDAAIIYQYNQNPRGTTSVTLSVPSEDDNSGAVTETPLTIGSNPVNAADVTYVYTATEAGTLKLTTGGAIMGPVSFEYSVNDGTATAIELSSSVDVALNANDKIVIKVVAGGYSSLTAEWTASSGSGEGGSGEGGSGDEGGSTGTGDGSQANPYNLTTDDLPYTYEVTGNHDVYYTYTNNTDADHVIKITYGEGALVSGLPGNAVYADGYYLVPVAVNETITINPWTMSAEEVDYVYTIAITDETVDSGVDEEDDIITYVNKVDPTTLTYTEVPGEGETWLYVDIYGETTDTAVLGEDGYYHLNSADGPVLLVDVDYLITLNAKLSSDIPVMYAFAKDENGNTVKYDIGEAATAYVDAAGEDYIPLTEDLIFFYQVYGANQGWYMSGASVLFCTVDSTEELDENGNPISSTVDTVYHEFNTEDAWMFACVYIGEESSNPETGDNTMLSVAIAAAIVSAMAIVALPVVKKHF